MSQLRIQSFSLMYHGDKAPVTAVNKVNLTVADGETVGVIGESGCGKTSLALAVAGLQQPPQATCRGHIHVGDSEVTQLKGQDLQRYRRDHVGIAFQNSGSALHPLRPIIAQLLEKAHLSPWWDDHRLKYDSNETAIQHRLDSLGLELPSYVWQSQPHELSGGVHQRVLLALAMMNTPQLLVADEPTANQDTIAKARLKQTLLGLKKYHHLTMLITSHDVGFVAHIADRLAIMYDGELLECGTVDQIITRPATAYGKHLIAACFGSLEGSHPVAVPQLGQLNRRRRVQLKRHYARHHLANRGNAVKRKDFHA